SFGFKASLKTRQMKPSQMSCGTTITPKKAITYVRFTTHADFKLSNLPRKQQALKSKEQLKTQHNRQRKIVNVIEVPPRPVQCITVDHPSHLFLCTKAMIPTHNTELQLRKALAFVARNPYRNLIYTMPNE